LCPRVPVSVSMLHKLVVHKLIINKKEWINFCHNKYITIKKIIWTNLHYIHDYLILCSHKIFTKKIKYCSPTSCYVNMEKSLRIIIAIKNLIHYIILSTIIVKVIKDVYFFQKYIVGENHIKSWIHILSYKLILVHINLYCQFI